MIVEAWNNRFLDGSVEVAPIITAEDWRRAFPLVFERGGYYFEGVWNGSTTEEQRLLQAMAAEHTEEGWSKDELAAATNMALETIDGVLVQAIRHDTLTEGPDSRWRFIMPLMREWVATDSAQARSS